MREKRGSKEFENMGLATCTNKGCGKQFDPLNNNNNEECEYHVGVPVFHEGLKVM